MNIKTYQKAKKYAKKIKYTDPVDLVHDLYLKWYDKTGQDLFDQPDGKVMSMIWKECNNAIRRGQWMWRGVRYSKIYLEFSEGIHIDDTGNYIPAHKANRVTPEHICIGNDILTNIRRIRGREKR